MDEEYKIIQRIGPYDGPYEKNIITYVLKSKYKRVAWHEKPNRKMPFNVGDVIKGLYVNDGKINYKKSKPIRTLTQIDMYASF